MIPENLTQDELVDWMILICEGKHPGVPFQPLVNHPTDLVELDLGALGAARWPADPMGTGVERMAAER